MIMYITGNRCSLYYLRGEQMALEPKDYQIQLTYTCKTITCKNVFWYKSEVNTTAQVLAGSFDNIVLPALEDILSSDVNFESTYAYSLANLDDFHTNTHTSTNGSRGADSLPVFCGWYFQMVRSTRQTAHGRKTFAGIAEGDVIDGSANPLLATNIAAVVTALETPLFVSVFGEATPMIAHTVEYTNPDNGKTYRIPETLYPINGVAYKRVSTQNSRKR